ncbi:MAG: hypothetical protein M1548_08590 [Actinobacteria bacterium]|nr:hypothetical protein [Actinomycetota bacterium]
MRKWTRETLDHVLDANAAAQDAADNVVPLFEGIDIRYKIDRTEELLRLRIRAFTRELAWEAEPVKRTMIYNDIKRLWVLETANEAQEDLQDCREARLISAIKRAIEKIARYMRKAAGSLEAILAAIRKTERKMVV